jgi:hypothetical protein
MKKITESSEYVSEDLRRELGIESTDLGEDNKMLEKSNFVLLTLSSKFHT